MRRSLGIVALDRKAASSGQYTTVSQQWNDTRLAELNDTIEAFSRSLKLFALRHGRDIQKNPDFRHAFQRMCASLMVDPLAGHPTTSFTSGRLGQVANLWSQLTGLNDWHYELGVQIVDVCISTRPQNGGIISMSALIDGIMRLRQSTSLSNFSGTVKGDWCITEEDISRSIETLQPLGCGYEVFHLRDTTMVRSMASDLSSDTLNVLNFLSPQGHAPQDSMGISYVTPEALSCSDNVDTNQQSLHWSLECAAQALDDMLLNDGTLWLDVVPLDSAQYEPEQYRRRYYAFSLAQTKFNSEKRPRE